MMALAAQRYLGAPLQHGLELETLIQDIVIGEQCRSYLEIGSKFGASLWRIANAMPVGSVVRAIDLPGGDGKNMQSEVSLAACELALIERGYEAEVYFGDSRWPAAVEFASASKPYDLVFIDGGHTLDVVRADWENYGPLGRIVALHDISAVPERLGRSEQDIAVPVLWNELKGVHKHREIRVERGYYGIGVIWR